VYLPLKFTENSEFCNLFSVNLHRKHH